MFHLLIGVTASGIAWIFFAVLAIPLWLGPLVQLLVSLLSRGKIARWIPAAFGLLGLVWSVWTLGIRAGWFPLWGIGLYWVVYALLLWAADTIGRRVREWLGRKNPAGKRDG